MNEWYEIRKKVLNEGVSKRQVMREDGLGWSTLKKILNHSKPDKYRMNQIRPKLKIGPFLDRIKQILDADKHTHKKQRHTAKRIFDRLRDEEGYTGGITQVKEAVRLMKRRGTEVYIPLVHRPGEAQVDFGWALVNLKGTLVKRPFFVMALPYSDAFFVQMFERESTEFVWEGHIRSFAYFGGVPWRISYDNPRTFVSKYLGVHEREMAPKFKEFVSHYLFEPHFCTVRRGNEKGVVEGLVKYSRSNFMVPVPQVNSLEELNEQLMKKCDAELKRSLRGKDGKTKGKLLEEERSCFKPLPVVPFDACIKQSTTSSSLSLVRFDKNDYSVPTEYAHHPVVVKGYINRVMISYKDKTIATHKRLWAKEGVVFNPVHYLAALERKPGAFDHARPLQDWKLPECFATLRRRMEGREDRHGDGTKEYIRTLRLMEKYSPAKVARAVKKAITMEIYTRDAIAQLVFPREDFAFTTFSLDGREHLRRVKVAKQDLDAYRELVTIAGAS